ncbi:2-amino-4-hydroxy-6-hydroxymethyldihydropteridine diphosphokinase [Kaarinaea lacus]
MPAVYISIGSNIDRERNIRSAVKALKQHFSPIALSSVYETQAQGFSGDPFYNLVAGIETSLSVDAINTILHTIENQHGRLRGEQKFSSRTLDLDLLLYGDAIMEDRNIPRDEITRYAFVLLPLVEIAPNAIHPKCQLTMNNLWNEFKADHDVSNDAIHAIEFQWDQSATI